MLTVGKSKARAGTVRTIPLYSELLKTLAERQSWYNEHIGEPQADHYVFPNFRDKRFDLTKPVSNFNKAWNAVREKSNVSIRFHDLRHTLITKLAEFGAGDETITAIAGHVSRSVLRRYAHIRTEAKRRALEAILNTAATVPVQQNLDGEAIEHVVVN
jgi:integrase